MDPFNENKPARSPWLVVLAVLTFIFSGMSFLGYFMMSMTSGAIPSAIEMYENMGMPNELIEAMRHLTEVPSWQFLLLSLGYALAVIGAALMLKINKIGLHLYIIAQIWLFVMCNLVIRGIFSMSMLSIFMTIVVISCYWLLMREAMRNKENENQIADYEEITEDQDDDDDE